MKWCTYPIFGQTIPLIPFHSILFQTIPLFKFYKPFHSIPFFFNLFFQLSKSLYNIFKSQPFIPPRNSQSQTIQHHFFSNHSKPFSNHFDHSNKWNGMTKMVCPKWFSKSFHSIPIFSTIFFNFLNSYTISLNLNHLYHLEIRKVKPFNIIFFQTIPNHFQTILTIPINRIKWPK